MSSVEYLAALAEMRRGAARRSPSPRYTTSCPRWPTRRCRRPSASRLPATSRCAIFARSGDFTAYTALLATSTGQPCDLGPGRFGEDGLPTNAHLVAKPLGEDTLLQLAAQLESARPGDGRRPELGA